MKSYRGDLDGKQYDVHECPFCGSKKTDLYQVQVVCERCNANGPEVEDEIWPLAITLWNELPRERGKKLQKLRSRWLRLSREVKLAEEKARLAQKQFKLEQSEKRKADLARQRDEERKKREAEEKKREAEERETEQRRKDAAKLAKQKRIAAAKQAQFAYDYAYDEAHAFNARWDDELYRREYVKRLQAEMTEKRLENERIAKVEKLRLQETEDRIERETRRGIRREARREAQRKARALKLRKRNSLPVGSVVQ